MITSSPPLAPFSPSSTMENNLLFSAGGQTQCPMLGEQVLCSLSYTPVPERLLAEPDSLPVCL